MKLLLPAVTLGLLAAPVLAQNTKGTGTDTPTTTRTSPMGSSLGGPSDGRSHATTPSGENRPNAAATNASQPAGERKNDNK